MDLYTIAQTALVAVLVGSSSSLLPMILSVLITCFCTVIYIDDRRRIAVLDHAIGSTGLCSRRRVGPNNPPADGLHFVFLSGPIFAVRATAAGGFHSEAETSYTLYVIGASARHKLNVLISGNPSEIMTRWIASPAAWRTHVTTVRQTAPAKARACQVPIVSDLCAEYTKQNRTSALFVGPPGIGKSRLAELLAVELRDRLAVEPVVVKNFDPTSRGLILDDVIGCPTADAPVIIVLDEYDAIIAHAEGKLDGDGEGSSIAKNRTSMLSCLDRLGVMAYIILIATTNVSTADLEPAYIREGRFDHRYDLA